jgi:hypothetical protein
MKPLEVYREAILQLGVAVDQLDQAHSVLKEIGLHRYTGPLGRRSMEEVCVDAERVLAQVETLECDSCGRAVAAHQEGECAEWAFHPQEG